MELFFTTPRLAGGLSQGLCQGLTLLALAMSSSGGLAQQAEDQLDRVSVQGSSLLHQARTDVRKACPSVQAGLAEAMSKHISHIGREGELLVVFELEGGKVGKVVTRGEPFEYRRPLRRAVAALPCSGEQQASQKYAFIVAFKIDDSSTPGSQTARIEPASIERMAMLAKH